MNKAKQLILLIESKLIGSAPTLDMLKDLIKKKWYWSTVEFKPIGPNEWEVHSGKGNQEGLRVILKNRRYRLEMYVNEGVLSKLQGLLFELKNLCRGKCVATSIVVGGVLKAKGFNVDLLDLTVDEMNHTVVLVNKSWVIDFTLGQFRKDPPFPYVVKLDSPKFKEVYHLDLPLDKAIKPLRVEALVDKQAIENLLSKLKGE
jgi:hypothetical protein